MGGCRCCFRQCSVASERNKGMHFFKFPKNHNERYQKWIKLAGVEHYLNYNENDLMNKVICARHFPDIHFMNYKRNRLTISALPILHRLNEEYALDYSNDANNPILIKIPNITRPHLIPPEGFPCAMVFTAADRKIAEDIIRAYGENTEIQMENSFSPPKRSARLMKTGQEVKKLKLIKKNSIEDDSIVYYELEKNSIKRKHFVLNDDTCEFVDISEIVTEATEPTSIDDSVESNPITNTNAVQNLERNFLDGSEEQLALTKSTQFSPLDQNRDEYFNHLQYQLTKELKNLEKAKQDLHDSKKKIVNLNSKLKEVTVENEQLKSQLLINEKENEDLSKKLLHLQSENKALEQHSKNLERKQKEQEQVTTSIPKQLISPTNQSQQLTKGQLFNGIKKYLSQTMIALLRIQLSSSSEEREWKPDERRLAVDLMGLGEEVYKYFSDELVIRLPPIRQVRQWQTDVDATVEEDEI